jgi:integrase
VSSQLARPCARGLKPERGAEHAVRRSLASVHVHVVAARLGHADPAVTLRVYSHVLREHAAGVGDIFAQAVNGAR